MWTIRCVLQHVERPFHRCSSPATISTADFHRILPPHIRFQSSLPGDFDSFAEEREQCLSERQGTVPGPGWKLEQITQKHHVHKAYCPIGPLPYIGPMRSGRSQREKRWSIRLHEDSPFPRSSGVNIPLKMAPPILLTSSVLRRYYRRLAKCMMVRFPRSWNDGEPTDWTTQPPSPARSPKTSICPGVFADQQAVLKT